MSREFRKRLGLRIRELRSSQGWSQERMANQCELDRSYLGGVERGERNVSIDNLCKIASALHMTPSALLELK